MTANIDHTNLPFGSRLTKQRQIILSVLSQSKSHLSAQDIFALVKKKINNISYATIYRNLNFLVRSGLVAMVECPGKEALFEVAKDKHSHFICLKCGTVHDLDDSKFVKLKLPAAGVDGHRILEYDFIYKGLCRKCKKGRKKIYGQKKDKTEK